MAFDFMFALLEDAATLGAQCTLEQRLPEEWGSRASTADRRHTRSARELAALKGHNGK